MIKKHKRPIGQVKFKVFQVRYGKIAENIGLELTVHVGTVRGGGSIRNIGLRFSSSLAARGHFVPFRLYVL